MFDRLLNENEAWSLYNNGLLNDSIGIKNLGILASLPEQDI